MSTQDTTQNETETFTIERDDQSDLRFNGTLMASKSSDADRGSYYFSGSTGRWTGLGLYRTAGGRFVCHQLEHTQWQGERDQSTAIVCDTEEEVIEFFGHGWLASYLYNSAGIEDVEVIE